jgi:hypothetical protein
LQTTKGNIEKALAYYNDIATTSGGSTKVNPSLVDFSKTPPQVKPKPKSKPKPEPETPNKKAPTPKPKAEEPDESDEGTEDSSEGSDASPKTPPASWNVEGGESNSVNSWVDDQESSADNVDGMSSLSRDQKAAVVSNLNVVGKSGDKLVIKPTEGNNMWRIGKFGSNIGISMVGNSSISAMIPMDAPLTQATFDSYAKKAIEYHKSEVADEAGMGDGFEVAGNEPMAYVTLSDMADGLTGGIAKDSEGFPDLLAQRYNVVRAPGGDINASQPGANPEQLLRTHFAQLNENGVTNIYLSIYAHGSEGAMHFGNNKITPAQLTGIIDEFPDMKVTVNSISCYGGGLAEHMEQYQDTKGNAKDRVTVFTQTKGETVNYANTSTKYVTVYNASLAKYLAQGTGGRPGNKMTYGEAHVRADRDAKSGQLTDAEVYTSRPNAPSAHTADLNDMGQFEGMA